MKKLSQQIVNMIDRYNPFMQLLQIGKRFNEVVDSKPTYKLYAWDYSNGTAIAYSEKEIPVAGDVVFLKEDMEGGKIADTAELKLVYHVVSDDDGVITVSEHPEGQTGGYTFKRNEADDYEEEITDVRDMVDVASNGLLIAGKGVVFKAINVRIES